MTGMPAASADRRRLRAALSLATAATLTLTACSSGEQDTGGEPAPAASSVSASPMDLDPFTMDVPALDLALLPGAEVQMISGTDPDYDAAWFAVPGADSWTQAMEDTVQARVDAYTRDASDRDRRLDVQPLLAVVGEDVAGVRILSTRQREDGSVASAQLVWYDAAERRVLQTRDLFSESGFSALRHELASRLQEDPEVNQDRLEAAIREPEAAEHRRVWNGLVFLEDGSVLLEVDQGSLAPESAGVLTARVDAAAVGSWLSEAGRRAQAAAQDPTALQLRTEPSAPAAPAPSSSEASAARPAETPSGSAPTTAPETSSARPSARPGGPGTPSGSASASSSARPSPSQGTGSPSATGSAAPSSGTPAPSSSARPSSSPRPGSATPSSPAPGPSTTSSAAPEPSDGPSPAPSSPTSTEPSPTEGAEPSADAEAPEADA